MSLRARQDRPNRRPRARPRARSRSRGIYARCKPGPPPPSRSSIPRISPSAANRAWTATLAESTAPDRQQA